MTSETQNQDQLRADLEPCLLCGEPVPEGVPCPACAEREVSANYEALARDLAAALKTFMGTYPARDSAARMRKATSPNACVSRLPCYLLKYQRDNN